MFVSDELKELFKRRAAAVYPNELVMAVWEYGGAEFWEGSPEYYALSIKCCSPGMRCLIHSHPDGPDHPSERDMQAQIALDVPFGLCVSTADGCTEPWYWGEGITAPLEGRAFRHGPTGTDGRGDCYALIRDWYASKGLYLDDVPRSDEWWMNGKDYYSELLGAWGFKEIPAAEAREGDLLMFQLPRSPVCNHGAVLLDGELILHHLSGRLSTIEPLGRWRPYLRKAARHAAYGKTHRAVGP